MINFKTIIRIIGILLLLETVMFLVCSGVSFYYRESDMLDFWKAGGITAGVGLLLAALGKGGERQLTRRDGYVLVSFAWVAFSLFGMLPFYIGGYIPTLPMHSSKPCPVSAVRVPPSWTTSSHFLMEYCSGAV